MKDDFIEDVTRPLKNVNYDLIGDKIDFINNKYKYMNTYNVPIEIMIEDLGITINYLNEETEKRGSCSIKDKTITIYNKDQYSKAEIDFTLAHNLAHFFLHEHKLKNV